MNIGFECNWVVQSSEWVDYIWSQERLKRSGKESLATEKANWWASAGECSLTAGTTRKASAIQKATW